RGGEAGGWRGEFGGMGLPPNLLYRSPLTMPGTHTDSNLTLAESQFPSPILHARGERGVGGGGAQAALALNGGAEGAINGAASGDDLTADSRFESTAEVEAPRKLTRWERLEAFVSRLSTRNWFWHK